MTPSDRIDIAYQDFLQWTAANVPSNLVSADPDIARILSDAEDTYERDFAQLEAGNVTDPEAFARRFEQGLEVVKRSILAMLNPVAEESSSNLPMVVGVAAAGLWLLYLARR